MIENRNLNQKKTFQEDKLKTKKINLVNILEKEIGIFRKLELKFPKNKIGQFS